jgi:hypothetical protein
MLTRLVCRHISRLRTIRWLRVSRHWTRTAVDLRSSAGLWIASFHQPSRRCMLYFKTRYPSNPQSDMYTSLNPHLPNYTTIANVSTVPARLLFYRKDEVHSEVATESKCTITLCPKRDGAAFSLVFHLSFWKSWRWSMRLGLLYQGMHDYTTST